MKSLASSVLLLAMSMSHTHASDGPALEETKQFIAEYANKSWKDGDRSWQNTVSFPEKCHLKQKTTRWVDGNINFEWKTRGTVDLSKLDPSTVVFDTPNNFLVEASSTAGKYLFYSERSHFSNLDSFRNDEDYSCDNEKCTSKDYNGIDSISIDDLGSRDTAERVAKALMHLINLCGGKSQLF